MKTEAERFWEKVEMSADCWLWTACKTSLGYGQFRAAGRVTVYAHRWSYENSKGAIPDGLVLDHLCRTTSCVRPDHLEAVTQRINVLRGESPSAKQARQTHCMNDHELAGRNLITDAHGKRRCRECYLAWGRNRRAERALELQS